MLLGDQLPLVRRGKVRDIYRVPGHPDLLLLVATDRLSTHNVVHDSIVPGKGAILTALTVFYAQELYRDLPTHLVAHGARIYDYVGDVDYPDLERRALVVKESKVDPVEYIYRDYLAGSLAKAYERGEDPYGLMLPEGLRRMQRFPETVFTPTEKSETDPPLPYRTVLEQYPKSAELTRTAYERLSSYLRQRGIVLVDAKFEAGSAGLVDEWGTGDCCRMAYLRDMVDGKDPPFLDKEPFRAWAERMWGDGERVPLQFPDDVIIKGQERYENAFAAITGFGYKEYAETYLA